MSIQIKAFLQIPSNATNDSGDSVSTLGELTQRAFTYSRNIQMVAQDSSDDLTLAIFNAVNSDDDSKVFDLSATECGAALTLLYSIKTGFDNSDTLDNYISNNPVTGISNVTHEDVVEENSFYLPKKIQFQYVLNTTTYIFDIWTSDATFESEYDVNEAVAIPPIAPVTALYNDYSTMLESYSEWGYSDTLNLINTATADDKSTSIGSLSLKWQDPSDTTKTENFEWTILGYGPNAQTPTLKLQAVRDYLTANSTYTLEQWRNYFPDIETQEFFWVIPFWKQIALTSGANLSSQLRPVFKLSTIEGIVTQVLTDRATADLTDLGEATNVLYRSTPIYLIASVNNAVAHQSFSTMYPDYTLMKLNDPNINRISAATQSTIQILDTLIRQAFVDDGSQVLPDGVTRNTVGNGNYLEGLSEAILFRVLTQASYDEVVIS